MAFKTIKQKKTIKTLKELHLDMIDTSLSNIRESNVEIDDLANSINENGLQNPICVYRENDKYYIISGHRRYLAFKKLSKAYPSYYNIPCYILDKPKNRETAQLVENIQRKDLTPAELERAIKKIIKDTGMAQIEVAQILGKSKSFISRALTASEIREQHPDIKDTTETQALSTFNAITEPGLKEEAIKKFSQQEIQTRAKSKSIIERTKAEQEGKLKDKIQQIENGKIQIIEHENEMNNQDSTTLLVNTKPTVNKDIKITFKKSEAELINYILNKIIKKGDINNEDKKYEALVKFRFSVNKEIALQDIHTKILNSIEIE